MGRRRSNKKSKDGESESDGTASDKPTDCLEGVKKMVSKMNTPTRKGASKITVYNTPSSTSRRMAPPRFPATPRSALRPNTANNGAGGLFPVLREVDPIQVFCRVKPLFDISGKGCIEIRGQTDLALIPPDNPAYWRQNQAKEGYYTFSTIFDETANQKAVFDEVALPLVADFVQGKNALLFAYGVTGSGKTYTMCGNSTDCGIMPRCLDIIFNSIAQFKATKYVFKPDRMNGFESQSKADAMHERQKEIIEKTREAGRIGTPRSRARNAANDTDNFSSRIRDNTSVPVKTTDSFYSVFITHIEIYNNFVYDLLDESPIEVGKKTGLQSKMLREDVSHNVYVNGVTEVEVESTEDAFEVFQRGLRRRRIAHTALNTESSRSHSIFNIRLVRAPADSEGEEICDNKGHIIVSQLSLVDLAGSERYSRTQATGDRLKEAGNINNSLMTLRKCMDILRDNQQNGANKVVPFRDSKLTHFLKNYFEGEGRVRMILCVNPRCEDYDENFHVLSFAEQAQEVQITRPQEKKLIEPPPTPTTATPTPGRVKANELYKESVRQLVAEQIIDERDLPKTDTKFVFMNLPIPIFKITQSNESEVLATLKKALEMRLKGLDELRKNTNEKQEAFRRMLVEMEHENERLKYENSSMQITVANLNEEKFNNEAVLRQMMQEKTELETRCKENEGRMEEMEQELADLRMQFQQRDMQHLKEKRMLKSDMDLKRELDDLKRQRQLIREEEKLKAKYQVKDQTLAAVRNLVSSVDISEKRQSRSRRRSGVLEDSLSTTSSEPDLTAVAKSSSRPKSRMRAPSAPLLPIVNSTPARSSYLGARIPQNNRRSRARSTECDVWVEHTAGIAVAGGTCFQPSMKKKTSVTKLITAEELNPNKVTKYCLRTQEADSDGEIATKLYKGDVLESMGGGSNVIFNDVEVLRQESPTSPRKRPSSVFTGLVTSSPFRNRPDENPEETHERCRVGIASSVVNKRSRHN